MEEKKIMLSSIFCIVFYKYSIHRIFSVLMFPPQQTLGDPPWGSPQVASCSLKSQSLCLQAAFSPACPRAPNPHGYQPHEKATSFSLHGQDEGAEDRTSKTCRLFSCTSPCAARLSSLFFKRTKHLQVHLFTFGIILTQTIEWTSTSW